MILESACLIGVGELTVHGREVSANQHWITGLGGLSAEPLQLEDERGVQVVTTGRVFRRP